MNKNNKGKPWYKWDLALRCSYCNNSFYKKAEETRFNVYFASTGHMFIEVKEECPVCRRVGPYTIDIENCRDIKEEGFN